MLFCSCIYEKVIDVPQNQHIHWNIRKVAVILPEEKNLAEHWKRTLELAKNNLTDAFQDQDEGVLLEYEWYYENTYNIDVLSKEICKRTDIVAVIGGMDSENIKIMASEFTKAEKTFFTLGTTEELVRAYSEQGYLWAMTETNITQCEILLSRAVYYGAQSVALLTNKTDDYCKTFIDWFAFQAKEMNLDVKGVYSYSNENITQISTQAANSNADLVICVPSQVEDIKAILKVFKKELEETGELPRTLFSDIAYSPAVIDSTGPICEGLEGITFGANPESGFDVSYEALFDDRSTLGEAQIYDAAMLLTLGLWYEILNPDIELKYALRKVVDGRDYHIGSWMTEHIRSTINLLSERKSPIIEGASGILNFDSRIYTNILNTTYYNFKIYNGEYVITDYITTNGSNRTDATLAGWNWKNSNMQDINNNDDEIKYPDLNEKWAVLIAGSKNWDNYRHQADVLAFYQMLKGKGYDDEHIILIMEDDIAYNKHNPNPGIITNGNGTNNLYKNVDIDYRLTDITPDDLCSIMLGEYSPRLPHVIRTTEKDNILVYWSGHGEKNYLCWADNFLGFSKKDAKKMFEKMESRHTYRKMIWFVETCYAGSVMDIVDGYPGILAITASDEDETSKADIFNENLGVWMSNRFSNTLCEELTNNEDITIQRIYYKLFTNTIGSHVMIYNQERYGNLFKNTMKEYL